MSVFCNQCGHHNADDSRFCSSCGNALEPTDTASDSTITLHAIDIDGQGTTESIEITGLPRGVAVLLERRGDQPGAQYVLGNALTIAGRSPEADIFLDDVTVSRQHVTIEKTDGGYEISDMGSLNGTYLNRVLVERAMLTSGDEIQIGKFRLVFLWTGE